MTEQEWVELYRHEIEGLMLDAAMTPRTGAELSVWLRAKRARITALMNKMHHDAQPESRALSNGHLANGHSIPRKDKPA